MSKVRDISNLSNIIKTDASGNVSFVSGSTTLATLNTSGQLSGSSPVLSSSYALNADLLDGLDSTQFTLTSSFAAQTASFTAFTSSILSYTASQNILNGTYATTGSNTFKNPQTINSNLTVTGSITAQTLVVQTITSSVDFVTGSTRFGSLLGNTHVFSGSVSMNPNGLFVSSSGNVGIGTTSPSGLLQVGVANSGIYIDTTTQYTPKIKAAGTISDIQIESVGSGGNVYLTAPGATSLITMSVSGSEKLRISSAGNVGIGTTNPTAKLEVKGIADGDLFIGRFHAGSAKLIYGYQLGSDGYLELRTGADAIITKLSGYTGTPSYFLSNVGINTTGSNSRVTIVDNNAPNASGNITSGTQFAASIASGFASLNVGAYDDGSSNRYGYLRTAYSDNAGVSSEMRFYTGATERMRISTGGIVTQPYQPAFSVANGAASTGPSVVPFKNVIFDDGNNFNTSTYRFTAPVAGRYFFSFYDNIMANSTAPGAFEFRVNGTRRGAIAYTSQKATSVWYIMSFQQVLKLSTNDYVEVYNTSIDSPDYGGDYSWGNFSGFLIG